MHRVFLKSVGLSAAALLSCLGSSAHAQFVQSTGADVIVGELPDLSNYSSLGGIDAFAVGTTSCNQGSVPLLWFTGGTDNRHPVIGQNAFRLANGRFEQLGQAWLKHGFTALQGTVCVSEFGFPCQATGGTTLGIGCSDPYSSGLNGGQSGLGPKWQVNASAGLFPYPFASPVFTGSIARRLQVATTDFDPATNPGARFFVEGQYVVVDDAAAGNKSNNASWREVTFTATAMNFAGGGTTHRREPAIFAWKAIDPAVVINIRDVANDGRYIVACRVTQSGPNFTYEYALQNLDSHRCAGTFTVPFPNGTSVNSLGFHDVMYHSGEPNSVDTDWTPTTSATQVSWAGAAYAGTPPVYTTSGFFVTGFTAGTGNDHSANVLRWGTLFNYRFTTTVAPLLGTVQVGLWRPGTPTSISMVVPTPGGATIGASSGTCCTGDTCSIAATPSACAGTFGTVGGTCSPNPCSSGACCIAGVCSITSFAGCAGTYSGGAACSPNPCPQPSGACCVAGICATVTQASCSGAYLGNGSSCSPNPCANNDFCTNAVALCDNAAVFTTNVGATTEAGASCTGLSGADLWFRYAPSGTTGTVSVTFTTDNAQITGGTTNFDTVLSLFGSCGGAQLACDDDGGTNPGLSSRMTFTLNRGQTYYVRVAGFASATGNVSVMVIGGGGTGCSASGSCCIGSACTQTILSACSGTWTQGGACSPSPCDISGSCCSAGNCSVSGQTSCIGTFTAAGTCTPNPCPPLNDDCNNRAGLGLGTQAFDTTNATTDGIVHNPTCLFFGTDQTFKDIWYNHPSSANGTLIIDTCGSAYDTKIAVYNGGGCLDFATRLLACNDDATGTPPTGCGPSSLNSWVSIPVVAGQNYTIRIGGFNTIGGAGQVTLTLVPNAATGSCCAADGSCAVSTQANCATTWTTGGVCSPNPCPQPSGACCCGSSCTLTLPAACTGTNQSFAGSGTACTPYSNTVPCCRGDYNKSAGIVSVQDIFDFLSGYFAGDACADTNDSGPANSVQDIFDFLAAYFGGC